MSNYDPKLIEKKWQEQWEKSQIYKTSDSSDKPKCYVLDMFPYPSGDGLHVGHPRGYIATDIYARMKRMQGFNVLHPMGWDAFGLPAENYAIKNKIHPRVAVEKNIARFKRQLSILGLDYDWTREINTTDPAYYKWTQWIFLKLLEKGLAYESYEPINWCPSCQTGLANEDLDGGRCERCESVVEKKPMRQWVLKITDYAERLLTDLDLLNWPESIKISQRNWIGRSEGHLVKFEILSTKPETNQKHKAQSTEPQTIEVFTTRLDTIYGATYLVLAPEHELTTKLEAKITNLEEMREYQEKAKQETEIERTAENREKTGVELKGIKAINPATGEEIPVWIADYVLGHYGTGAIMAVPAHDVRDFTFAKKFELPVRVVVQPQGGLLTHEKAFIDRGILTASEEFSGLSSVLACDRIAQKIGAKKKVTYKLRDWVFSRQRYWGEPIPVIHCLLCGVVPVSEDELPVTLPAVERYEPTGTGESPLANIDDWVNTTCPTCGASAKRETNTMPQWAGSSWYYLRYLDPKNDVALADKSKTDYWLPVDTYVGGTEHATRHLIYARFWHKFLLDMGMVSTPEPFLQLRNQGLIVAEDGRKMSKRWGNIINPDDIIETYGADSLRLYEMFMGPFEQSTAWQTRSIIGVRRFLERIWNLERRVGTGLATTQEEQILHASIRKVTDDIQEFRLNTTVSALMICLNELEELEKISQETYDCILQLLAPLAPHLTEELWQKSHPGSSIHLSTWPIFQAHKAVVKQHTLTVQINAKVRAQFETDEDLDQKKAEERARALPKVQKWLKDKAVQRVIYIPNKLINIVTLDKP